MSSNPAKDVRQAIALREYLQNGYMQNTLICSAKEGVYAPHHNKAIMKSFRDIVERVRKFYDQLRDEGLINPPETLKATFLSALNERVAIIIDIFGGLTISGEGSMLLIIAIDEQGCRLESMMGREEVIDRALAIVHGRFSFNKDRGSIRGLFLPEPQLPES